MIKVNTEKCDQCGTCVSVCPSGAIMMVETLSIDMKNCINCSNCVKVCAFAALSAVDKDEL